MKKYRKILVFILATILLTSLTVRSDIAPNMLEVSEGISVFGDLDQHEINGTMEFSIDKIWHDPFLDEDIVEMSRNMTNNPPYPTPYNVSQQHITSLIFTNRSVLIPAYYSSTVSVNGTIIFFFNITGSLDIGQEDLIVTYEGENYTVEDIDPMSELYANISIWYLSFLVGNSFEYVIMPLTRYAISPQATIGQEIDYGNYTGEVVGFTDYEISETETYEVIEVHHEEVNLTVNLFGTPENYTIGETTFLYEKQTGIVLHWVEYNSTTDEYYFFNATKVVIPAPPIPEYSVPSLILLSTIMIATPIIQSRKRKK